MTAKTNLELKQAEVVADAGYYNAGEVSRCVEAGLTPLIPKADTSANTARGLYGQSRFRYEATKDVYVCPAGAELTYNLKRVLNLVSFEKLMAAVGVKVPQSV